MRSVVPIVKVVLHMCVCPSESSALWLVYPKINVLSPKLRVFIEHLLDRLGKTPVWNAA